MNIINDKFDIKGLQNMKRYVENENHLIFARTFILTQWSVHLVNLFNG